MIRLPGRNVYVLRSVEELYYFDSQVAEVEREVRPVDFWNFSVRHPLPFMQSAFWIRDRISSLFGVKKIGGFSAPVTGRIREGDFLDFFLVEYVDETTLVLTERDRHLDVMTCISTEGNFISVTSSVIVHNMFGRVYMFPVGIAHRWIVRAMLKRLQRVGKNI
ncbi:DUF2867 domain-containing protein [Pseudovibrio japonicus]|uniref:DUF2867 domain-containing protein n=1 Tax=Pseudovibrio japonicus TaxID=366534 RepID=UPI00167552EE